MYLCMYAYDCTYLRGAAVFVVCIDVVIMDIKSSEKAASRWTAHGRGDVRMREVGTFTFQMTPHIWHEVH